MGLEPSRVEIAIEVGMAGIAEVADNAGLSERREGKDEFPTVLQCAVASILDPEMARKPFPLIQLRDFFPKDFYARLLQRFPDVDRFAGLNGDGTRREYALYDERSDPGSKDGRELWG